MTLKQIMTKNILKIVSMLSLLALICIGNSYDVYAVMIPNDSHDYTNSCMEVYTVNQEFTSDMMKASDEVTNVKEYDIDLTCVQTVYINYVYNEEPCCGDHYSRTSTRFELELIGPTTCKGESLVELSEGKEWREGKVRISQIINTGAVCPTCGGVSKMYSKVNSLVVAKQKPYFKEHPTDITVEENGNGSFNTKAHFYTGCRWQRFANGAFVDIYDGVDSSGTVFKGADTPTLSIANVQKAVNGSKYRCKYTGINESERYSKEATITVPSKEPIPTVTPTVTPTQIPSPTITPTPTVVPGILPTLIPTPPPSTSSYRPASSSSSYPTGPVTPIIPPPSSSSTSSSMIPTPPPGEIKPIIVDVDDEDDEIVIPAPSSSSAKGSSSSRKPSKSSSSSRDAKSIANVRGNTARTVMKNGVLYIIDDDEEDSSGIEDSSSDGNKQEEQVVLGEAYSSNDLMLDEDLKSIKKSYSPWVYVGIIAGFIVGLLLLLFLLFFGVIIEGECEEHDEVFELCGITLVYRKDGEWCVKLNDIFDENAVARLRLGYIFAIIFKDCELKCYTTGANEGEVIGLIEQKMLVYRKKVRRQG